jgi:phage repressor protein C with HTH and peptisase S24 domain
MKERLIEFLKYMNISQRQFEINSGLSNGFVDKVGDSIRTNNLNKILSKYPNLNINWLKTGEGNMLKSNLGDIQFYDPENASSGKKLIPFYDDVSTIGGNLSGYSASIELNSPPAEWIDPGDWFKNATAALRHYGDSMKEYQSGCILALREVQDRRLIIPGKDYVIETSEYRVTKKVQLTSDPEYLRVHSTNDEKYDDGTLIHQPFNVPWDLIGRIFEVLGYVVKKGGGTIVYSNSKR